MRDKHLDFVGELKKLWNMQVTVIQLVVGDSKRIGKETRRLRNQITNRDHPNYGITNIGQNTLKCPGDLR